MCVLTYGHILNLPFKPSYNFSYQLQISRYQIPS